MSSFDLAAYLRERRRRIERALEARLPAETEPPAALHRAMRYAVLSGGKRLRPILCLAAAEAAGGTAEAAMPPALAVELFHTYTLVHDDLPCMDDDDLRRGKPTTHKVFGEANAVLAGDALQAMAFEVLAEVRATDRHPLGAFVAEFARAAGSRGVIGGQADDLAAAGAPLTAERVDWVHQRKTAELFRASLRLGAMAADAGPQALDALATYGLNLGLAFQIADDLADADGGPGKARGDMRGVNCLDAYDADAARQRAGALLAKAEATLRALPAAQTAPLAALAGSVLASAMETER